MSSPAELKRIAAAFKARLQQIMARDELPENLQQAMQAMTRFHDGYVGSVDEVIDGLQQADAKKTLGVALAGGGTGAAAGGTAGYLLGKDRGAAEADPMTRIMANLEKLSSDAPATTKKQASYRGFLSLKEQAACMHTGALMYAASTGMRKQALFEGVGDVFDAGTKAVVVGSLVTGIPVGIMAHMLTNATKRVRADELIRKKQLDYYRTAGSSLEAAMANRGIQA